MPTTYVWNSTTSNMATSTAYTPSGTPATGDTLIFPENATVAPASNMSTHTAVVWAVISIAPGCRIDIGSSGNPFVTGATKLTHKGLGTLYYENTNAGVESVFLASPNVDAAMVIASGSALYSNITIGRGHLLFGASGAAITRVRLTSTGFPSRDAKFTATASSAAIGSLSQQSGESKISVGVTFLRVGGGRYEQVTGTIADAFISNGYVLMGPSGGVIGTTGDIIGGTLDLTTNPYARTMGTITKYRGANYLYNELTTHTLVDLAQEFGVN